MWAAPRIAVLLGLFLAGANSGTSGGGPAGNGSHSIQTVFLIMMENHNWSGIARSSAAPYIDRTLVKIGAHASQYYNPPGVHPSLPNYLWLEAGTNFGIHDDDPPDAHRLSTSAHLATLLSHAHISWRVYAEGITGTTCPLGDHYPYAVRHDPTVYFDDVTQRGNPNSGTCIQGNRPFSQLASDLAHGTVARYNLLIPNVCDDMHDVCSSGGPISQGDTWLSHTVPEIMRSAVYRRSAIFITWDEGEGGDGPIGMIAVSPFARRGYTSSVHYTHSSTLRTLEEIFGVRPFLGDAARARDLSTLFTHFP